MTLTDLITHSAARLTEAGVSFGHGTTNAHDEAVWLTLWQLGLPLDELDSVAHRPISADEQQAVDALVSRRIDTRRPAAYLTREAWLQGVPFYIDERAIVPRSLIAELIADGSLDGWLSDRTRHVLDLCTGNGSLAVLAAMAWPDIEVDALDLSPDALDVARINVARHGLQHRIHLSLSDGLAAARPPYDLVVCNPPYVNQAAMAHLPLEYQAEPALALDGGPDGMDFVRRLLTQAADVMSPDAVLVLEIGHERDHYEHAFPALVRGRAPATLWLPTSGGDDQVLLLTRSALVAAQAAASL